MLGMLDIRLVGLEDSDRSALDFLSLWRTYMGMRAMGAVKGMPTMHHINFFLWKLSRSVLKVFRMLETLSAGTKVLGKTTSAGRVCPSSSSRRLVDSGGTDLRPHSS